MATSTSTRDRLTTATGFSSAWIDTLLRFLREGQLLQTAQRGGGRAAVHYSSMDLALIMLGLAAVRAVEVAAVVKLLKDLRFQVQDDPQSEAEPFPMLQEQVANWIENAAAARRLGKEWSDDSKRLFRSWELNICLETAVVFFSVEHKQGDAPTNTVYAIGPVKYPGARRHTVLNGDVLLAFGELFADTQLERERLALRNPSARTVPENDDANRLCQEETAPSHQDQSRSAGSEAVASSETTGGFAQGEDSSRGGTDHDSKPEPDLFTHAGSSRCLTLT